MCVRGLRMLPAHIVIGYAERKVCLGRVTGVCMPDSWIGHRRGPERIVTAAATHLADLKEIPKNIFTYDNWQDEAWTFWRSLGELNNGIMWLSNSLSRLRLNVAEMVPGGEEPEILKEGVAAELMEKFAGGTAGQSQILGAFGTQLGVPGEGWLTVERDSNKVDLAAATWRVMPTTACRLMFDKGRQIIKIRVSEKEWRPLADEGLATKIFKEDAQYPWKSFSVVQAALPILRRIDLVDRRIVAIMVSRLAMNGILLYPQEGTFSVPKQYKDAADPFAQMFVDLASNNIRYPGAASAAIPMLIKFSAEYIDKWKLLKWDDLLPPELLQERKEEIERLATTLVMPREWLTGRADMNHWNGFLESEEAIKIYLSPTAEIICDGLTKGYLYPLLKQLGEEPVGPKGGKLIVWYDASELTSPPDKTTQALAAYDRLEGNGTMLRRELGLDEADKPSKTELNDMILKKAAVQPQTAMAALAALTGKQTETPAPGAVPDSTAQEGDSAGPPANEAPAGTTAPERTTPAPATATSITMTRIGPPSPRPRVYNGVK